MMPIVNGCRLVDSFTVHSGQIGWQNPFGHSLILKLFWTFWILLDIERSFIRVKAMLERDLYAQMGQEPEKIAQN